MKAGFASFVTFLLAVFVFSSPAGVLYVDLNSTNPVSPYAGWSTAATNIQDAIAASTTGDTVLVTNGIYAVGGKSMDGVITNRVSVDKAITVQTVNGPYLTVIQGAWDPVSTNGPSAVRCAWLTNNAVLSGFTLRGGATRPYSSSGKPSTVGGGVWGNVTRIGILPGTHLATSATVTNCIVTVNSAGTTGGGAYGVELNSCLLIGNSVGGVNGTTQGNGGGAEMCNLTACLVTENSANANGGGTDNCCATNSAFTQNKAVLSGSGINSGSLVNCTLTQNISGGYGDYGGAAANAALTNCIVYQNFNIGIGSTNYASCTFSYSDTDPLPSGIGNVDVDPQLIADGVHLTRTSPCLGLGTTSVVSGTDIDGQPWNNPPSIGCDEWLPIPAMATQPSLQINSPAYGLTFNVLAAGETPFSYFWNKDGVLIQDDSHHSNSGTANLVVNHFGPEDAGFYQVVVSNAAGIVTSQVAQVVIHAVNTTGTNPVPPYSNWATAASNIQDAINVAGPGDIVLVTNGVYAAGGKIVAGGVTNRVVVDRPITVTSVNGYPATSIQGAWDPVSTNGPAAVRCAWLTGGARLSGFTLVDGAAGTNNFVGSSTDSGGGVFCASTNEVIANCVLTNNSAIFGAGVCSGTLNNCLLTGNTAFQLGGGALLATLNNCTVVSNFCNIYIGGGISAGSGAGAFDCIARNTILLNNFSAVPYYPYLQTDNYGNDYTQQNPQYVFTFCDTDPLVANTGNIDAYPQFLDLFHITSTSPCYGSGSALYSSGTDLDGEAWANPPSMGCDEVILSNLIGPLAVSLSASQTNVLVSLPGFWPPPHYDFFQGNITGRVAYITWSFGDGPVSTNFGLASSHSWTNTGDYTVTFTAYNTDNPAGVSTNTLIHVLLPDIPQLQSPALLTNGFQFQFAGQWNANYTIQYTTNLAPPVTWQTLQTIIWNYEDIIQISDSAPTNVARFYRVLAQ
ncbi:MAG: PKD domain-containing protein [Limisphaerales bacterium]